MHQGDFDKDKGVIRSNGVDEVTQYQFAACVERICERHPPPVLGPLLAAFPFVVQGFHSYNSSHYVNHQVAALVQELGLEKFAKPRQRPYNNDVSAESKEGGVICRQRSNENFAGRNVEECAPAPQKGLGTGSELPTAVPLLMPRDGLQGHAASGPPLSRHPHAVRRAAGSAWERLRGIDSSRCGILTVTAFASTRISHSEGSPWSASLRAVSHGAWPH